jgi:alpha-galactosidase
VIFNDYLNTVNGDPTTDRLMPLVEAAARAGAEIFCIDAGWYAEGAHWWDSVGEWLPSRSRFPGGLGEVTDRIKQLGMTVGLWLEPEVVGVRSPLAATLPPDAFFQRDGETQIEQGRHHLDLRHPAARDHLDQTVDRLVREFDVGYFKFDYNINATSGTDVGGTSPGHGALGHNRAFLDWVRTVADRHPHLIIENCASGAMRMDPASLAVLNLQSTSDQEDPQRYPPIAASAPLAMPPEQAASWASPQPSMSIEETIFSLVTGLSGRMYLSGNLDWLTSQQFDLAQEAVTLARTLHHSLPERLPFWPLGLPAWDADWVALGLKGAANSLLAVWRRSGVTRIVLPIEAETVEQIYPEALHWGMTLTPGRLALDAPSDEPSARLFRLSGASTSAQQPTETLQTTKIGRVPT